MYRSVSTNRLEGNDQVLPLYNELHHQNQSSSDIYNYKKEKGRAKFAENAVHLIPLVLFFCAFILWFLSNPDVDLPTKGDTIAARIEGLTLEGDIDSDGTQRGVLPDPLHLSHLLVLDNPRNSLN